MNSHNHGRNNLPNGLPDGFSISSRSSSLFSPLSTSLADNGLPSPSRTVGHRYPHPPSQHHHYNYLRSIMPHSAQLSWQATSASQQHPSIVAAASATVSTLSQKHQVSSTFPASAPATEDTLSNDGESEVSASNKNKPSEHKSPARNRKYNHFNIFFMLEHQLLLQSRGGGINAIENPIDTTKSPLTRHNELQLPPLCQRYNRLPLTRNWFLELIQHDKNKRKCEKSHGLVPFKEMAQTVAKNYREIDDDTQEFLSEVAERLGSHLYELDTIEAKDKEEANRQQSSGGTTGSVGGGKKKKGKRKLNQDESATAQQLIGMKNQKKSHSSPHTILTRPPSSSSHASQDLHPLVAHPSSEATNDLEQECPILAKEKVVHSRTPMATNRQHAFGGDSEGLDSERLQIKMALQANNTYAHPPTTVARGQSASTTNFTANPKMNHADPELERLQNDLKGIIAARYGLDRKMHLLKDQIIARVEFLKEQIDAGVVQARCSTPATETAREDPRYRVVVEACAQTMQQHRQADSAAASSASIITRTIIEKLLAGGHNQLAESLLTGSSPRPSPLWPSPMLRHYPNVANALAYPEAKTESEYSAEMTHPAGGNPLEALYAGVKGGSDGAQIAVTPPVASLVTSMVRHAGDGAEDHEDKVNLLNR